ncbi:uncharacterized protein LOC106759084 [Vigna radiata var. radiata]|uniref:Uncharacterized protein LOC106759084 n=1 Tax=Vigna radiata var. radiata TaxID=3916 RepID=A0A1S3TUW5_VIGRR|nr:uncharacterized protein LOC106759084 [Vigna radiata var. radiata]XP_022635293.1 uncharacterized protein LOC106759084 [Vigna radiata var. radiata]
MQKMARARGEELVLLRKRSNEKENDVTESKPENMSKKKSNMYGQNKKKEGGKESLKVIKEETEKLSIKESKEKSGTHSNKVCYCAPTTHEGSFRCRLHRKKSGTDGKSNTRMNSQCTKGMMEFQPQFSTVGRVPSVQVGTHGTLLKLLRMDSV